MLERWNKPRLLHRIRCLFLQKKLNKNFNIKLIIEVFKPAIETKYNLAREIHFQGLNFINNKKI